MFNSDGRNFFTYRPNTNKEIEHLTGLPYPTVKQCKRIMDFYDGDLVVSASIKELPDNLTVNGDLIFPPMSQIKALPNNLTVKGRLDISGTNINELPNDLKVGSLVASCSYITSIPSGVYIERDICVNHSQLADLPDNITIEGNLHLSGTHIEKLPRGLKVGGYIDISHTGIRQLPDDIEIRGSIYAQYTSLEALPEHLTHIHGRLQLSHTNITKLPDNLTVDDDLVVSCNEQLLELPEGLTVVGSLDASYTGITELPKRLSVDGLTLVHAPIDKLPDDMSFNTGHLDITNTKITKLPDNLIVGSYLDVSYTPLTKLPDGLIVYGSLIMQMTMIDTLPDNLIVGADLTLSQCRVSELPNGCVIGGNIYCRAPLTPPADFKVGLHRMWIVCDADDCCVDTVECDPKYQLTDGEYVEGRYLYADGILTPVKSKKTCAQYTIYYGKIPGKNVVYDGTYYAHCAKIRDGLIDIRYKYAKDRGTNQYRELTLDSVISRDDAIAMYRVITGACQQGTQIFLDSLGDNIKDEYTVAEIIEITSGQYGSDKFKEFFDNTEE